VHRLFGLSRDPYAPVCDGDLYWENPRRRDVRSEVSRLLLGGNSVWLHGEAGAGRESVMARAVEEVALAGRPVIWGGSNAPADAQALLDLLLDVAGVGTTDGALIDRAAAVYQAMLDGFSRGGPVVVALQGPADEGARTELEVLASLRVAGKQLVALATWGEGKAPVEDLAAVELPSFSKGELGSCIVHRSTACGGPDLLTGAAIDAVVRGSQGVGDAVRRARDVVFRMAFSGPPVARGNAAAPPSRPVLDRAALEEVDQLLGTLTAGVDSPQNL